MNNREIAEAIEKRYYSESGCGLAQSVKDAIEKALDDKDALITQLQSKLDYEINMRPLVGHDADGKPALFYPVSGNPAYELSKGYIVGRQAEAAERAILEGVE